MAITTEDNAIASANKSFVHPLSKRVLGAFKTCYQHDADSIAVLMSGHAKFNIQAYRTVAKDVLESLVHQKHLIKRKDGQFILKPQT